MKTLRSSIRKNSNAPRVNSDEANVSGAVPPPPPGPPLASTPYARELKSGPSMPMTHSPDQASPRQTSETFAITGDEFKEGWRNLKTTNANKLAKSEENHKILITYVNKTLAPRDISITNLTKDLQNGIVLINLFEVVSGTTLSHYYRDPRSIPDQLENLEIALKFASHLGVRVEAEPQDIHRGLLSAIVAMLFLVAQKFKDGNKLNKKRLFGRKKKKVLDFKAENREKYLTYRPNREDQNNPDEQDIQEKDQNVTLPKEIDTDIHEPDSNNQYEIPQEPEELDDQTFNSRVEETLPAEKIVMPEYDDYQDRDLDIDDIDENMMMQHILDLDKLSPCGDAIKLDDDIFRDLEKMQNMLEDIADGFGEDFEEYQLNLDDMEIDLGI